jgi:DNA-3-methyladenine glycosylase II
MKSQIKKAEHYLRDADPVMAGLIAVHGPCTLFSANALIHKSGFHALAWAIINQQLSVASAKSIENKLLVLHSKPEFTASTINRLSDDQLAACGLSRQKIRYLRALCAALKQGKLDLESLSEVDDASVAKILIALPGIGPWTVDMFLMFSLGRLDVLPLGDLALRKSFNRHYKIENPGIVDEYQQLALRWRPYRTVASWYLWASVD